MVVATPSTYTYTGGKIQPTYAVLDGAIALYKKGEVNDKDAEYEEVSISNAVMLVLEQSLYRDATTSIQEKQLEHLQSQLQTQQM